MPYKLKEKDHNKVVIVIPIYQSVLKDYEMSALKNNLKVLAKYPTVFLKPKGLEVYLLVLSVIDTIRKRSNSCYIANGGTNQKTGFVKTGNY